MESREQGIKKRKIIMMQLPYPETRTQKTWGNVPWGAASLKTMALDQGLGDWFDIEILSPEINDHAGDASLINYLFHEKPDIVCATLYLWNAERSLFIAAELKKHIPELLFVVGGPEVCEDSSYIMEASVVDYGGIGEGEFLFIDILRTIVGLQSEPQMEGIFFRQENQKRYNPGRAIITDLAQLPSPIKQNILELKNAPSVAYETMRGCPCSCSYCMTGTLSWRIFPKERILADLARCKELGVKKIRMACSNFLLHPDFFSICAELAKINYDRSMDFVCFSYAEQITEKHAQSLYDCNFTFIETGLQTVNNETLKKIQRPSFNSERFVSGLNYLKKFNIEYNVDLIIGLPGESSDDISRTIHHLEMNNIHKYGLFRLQLLPNTQLRKQAVDYGLSFSETPPYSLLETPNLKADEIDGYSILKKKKGEVLVDYDYLAEIVPEMKIGREAPSCKNFEQPTDSPSLVHRIRISSLINCERAIAKIGSKMAANTVLIFSNLIESLSVFSQFVTGIWHLSPYTNFRLIFHIENLEDAELVRQVITTNIDSRFKKTTVIVEENMSLDENFFSTEITIMKRVLIDHMGKVKSILDGGSLDYLVHFIPELPFADRLEALKAFSLDKSKKIQYETLSDYILTEYLRKKAKKRLSETVLGSSQDIGCNIFIDEVGQVHPELMQNEHTKVKLIGLQYLMGKLK